MENSNQRQQRFLELFEPIRERLWRFIRVVSRADSDTVDDVMSETVLIVYQQLDSLKDEKAFASYCFTIARRVYRKMLWRQRIFSVFDPTSHEQISAHPSPEQSADVALVYDALNKLPIAMRETLILFELFDLSLEGIRAIQGGTLSGVKSRLKRGREKLALILGERSQQQTDTSYTSIAESSTPIIELQTK